MADTFTVTNLGDARFVLPTIYATPEDRKAADKAIAEGTKPKGGRKIVLAAAIDADAGVIDKVTNTALKKDARLSKYEFEQLKADPAVVGATIKKLIQFRAGTAIELA